MSTSSTRARPGGSGESTPQQPNSQNKRAQGPSHQHPYHQPEVYGPWAPQQPPMLSPYQNAPQYNQWAPQQPPMPSPYQNAPQYNQWAPQQPPMPSPYQNAQRYNQKQWVPDAELSLLQPPPSRPSSPTHRENDWRGLPILQDHVCGRSRPQGAHGQLPGVPAPSLPSGHVCSSFSARSLQYL